MYVCLKTFHWKTRCKDWKKRKILWQSNKSLCTTYIYYPKTAKRLDIWKGCIFNRPCKRPTNKRSLRTPYRYTQSKASYQGITKDRERMQSKSNKYKCKCSFIYRDWERIRNKWINPRVQRYTIIFRWKQRRYWEH